MRSTAVRVAGALGMTIALGLLLPAIAAAHSPTHGTHREPLPTVEVVPPPPKRVRLIDMRGPLQFGGGWSTLYDAPVYAMSFEASASFVELGPRTWLHLTFGESGVVSAIRRAGQERSSGFLGVDVGLGIAHHARRGPALVLTSTAGPRWGSDGPDTLRPHGYGLQTKVELYPFYVTVPDIVEDGRCWFRRYVLSGLSLWASGRYDQVLGERGNTGAAGVGLDLGRSVILPALMAMHRRRSRR